MNVAQFGVQSTPAGREGDTSHEPGARWRPHSHALRWPLLVIELVLPFIGARLHGTIFQVFSECANGEMSHTL